MPRLLAAGRARGWTCSLLDPAAGRARSLLLDESALPDESALLLDESVLLDLRH